LDDAAVLELARDVDSPERRAALSAALEQLEADPQLLERLRDPELAWQAFACGLRADALGDEDS
jgi:hypothetical protein